MSVSRPAVTISVKPRWGAGVWVGEALATFGLLLVVLGVVRSGRAAVAPFAVGAYIAGAYWFTSPTSFANPAVTLARTLSNTFAGIAPASVPPFLGAEAIACVLAVRALKVFYPSVGGTGQRGHGG